LGQTRPRFRQGSQQQGNGDNLAHGFELAPEVSPRYGALIDAPARDRQLPRQNDKHPPGRNQPLLHQNQQRSHHQQLIHQGIQELPQLGHLIQLAGQVAIQPIRRGNGDKNDNGDPALGGFKGNEAEENKGHPRQAQEGDPGG